LPFAAIPLFVLFAAMLPRLWRASRRTLRVRRIARGGGSPSDAAVLYERMLEILERRGFPKPAFRTPVEFARTLPPAEREPVARFTALYNAARFGGNASATVEMAEMLPALQKR
jgi:hypothetical protein